MNTTDVLRRKRADLLARITFIDELLAEMGDAPPEPLKPAHPTPLPVPAKSAPSEDGRAAGPKAARLARPPAGQDKYRYPERLAAALLVGPLSLKTLCDAADISYPTAARELKTRPEWFQRVGQGVATQWTLTERGRAAAEAAR